MNATFNKSKGLVGGATDVTTNDWWMEMERTTYPVTIESVIE